MIELFRFNGPAPFSIIFWQRNGEYVSKTICYTKEEECEAISRFYTPNDFYSTFDAAIIRREKEVKVYSRWKSDWIITGTGTAGC
ncbi:UNVERIFIED_ORG: hypothetical protein BDK47_1496 [Anoxybacillus amylolyticus]|uniref:Uncharacterized protein n=1 Tax=Bacillus phage 1 TaxID=2785079 RepID=B3RH27_9CAUD|nr:hypothetical protein BV1_gp56 [Bacillus phage 1]ACE78272.1 hypothetical protein [Bacillus phage 1]